MPIMKPELYYAIRSGPGLNYEGKVFTSFGQLAAYKKDKRGPRGKLPWFKRFDDRAQAYKFAEIPLPAQTTQPVVKKSERKPVSPPRRQSLPEDVDQTSTAMALVREANENLEQAIKNMRKANERLKVLENMGCPVCLGTFFKC